MRNTIHTFLERVEIVATSDERNSVLDDLEICGYTIRAIGPYTDQAMFPKVDPNRLKVVAERTSMPDESVVPLLLRFFDEHYESIDAKTEDDGSYRKVNILNAIEDAKEAFIGWWRNEIKK